MVGHEPKAQEGDRYDRAVAVPPIKDRPKEVRAGPGVVTLTSHLTTTVKMTLCGSEVPQDRWRGRTAGSGMWTRTRESALGAPCGDSAIPYG